MRHRLLRALLAAVLGSGSGIATATAPRVALPERIAQGDLVIGQAGPGAQVRLGRRALRVDREGRFVFGVARDEPGPLRLELVWPDGVREQRDLTVDARRWPVEHVTGVPPRTVEPPPEIAARIAREQAAVAAARARDDARSDFAFGFDWPVEGRISGRFGSARSYNGKPGSPHSGVDVAAPTGTALRAPAPGVVSFVASDLYLTGGTVLLDHGHGVSSVFLHMSRIDVSVGALVDRGQVLGAVGATGRASGPHMHWGLNWFEVRLDPVSVAPPMRAPR